MMPTDGSAPPGWVICLCAEWCNVCREWRDAFNETAAAYPQLRFAWVDVEDESDAMGDLDIETFPTVLLARGEHPLFLGPIQPSGAQLARLVDSLLQQGAQPRPLTGEAAALMQRLNTMVLPKP
jgi:thioredoxin 1